MLIETARLRLEPLRVGHAEEMMAVLADVELYEFTGGRPPTPAELRRRYELQVAGPGRPDEVWRNWILRRTETDQAVGYVQATITGASAEVAWVIGRAFQGQGFGIESVSAMCRWLASTGVERLTAHIHPDHVASNRLAEAIGMVDSGRTDDDGERIWTRSTAPPTNPRRRSRPDASRHGTVAAVDRWITHWAEHRPDHPALRFAGETVGYRDLEERVTAWAATLTADGVEPGDRVAVCTLNRLEPVVLLFACARIGAILLPLNNRLTAPELRYQLTDAEPTVAIVGDGFGPTIAEAVPDLDRIELDEPPRVSQPTTAAPTPTRPDGDRPVLMVYTSGTTGKPKGAVHTTRSLLHTVLNSVAHQDLTADDVVLTVLPLFHVGGLNIQTLPALYVGATTIIHRRFDPGDVLDTIEEHSITQTLLVPAAIDAVVAHPSFATTDLGSLRGLNTGSSVVPERTIRGFLYRGVPVGQVYGSTETGPTTVVLRYEDAAANVGSCGKAALHSELRIVTGPDDVDVEPGQVGELLIRGPNLFDHYWRNPEATRAAFTGDGWYRTGDVGRTDRDGFVFIEDRIDDVLISGGENVYPAEVEATLGDHPAIGAVAVVGRPDHRWGEIPVAVIEPTAPGEGHRPPPTLDELRAWCADRLARFKQPRELIVVEQLPRTALGKVQKHLLRHAIDEPADSGPPLD